MNKPAERRACETCRKYEAFLDRCPHGRSTKDPELCREGCGLWEREISRKKEQIRRMADERIKA